MFSYVCVIGLLDTITTTADSKDCPGVCVHALASIICYDVLEDIACPSSSMKCCVEPPGPNETLSNSSNVESTTVSTTTSTEPSTTVTTTRTTTVASTTTSQVCVLTITKTDLLINYNWWCFRQ